MKYLVVFFCATCLAAVANTRCQNYPSPIGNDESQRWAVKTLDDKSAIDVSLDPEEETVEELSVGVDPEPGPDDGRRPDEKQVYSITAKIVGYFLAPDLDIVVVIQDPKHGKHTMHAEIPEPECEDVKNNSHAALFRIAKEAFLKLCGNKPPTPVYQKLAHPVIIEVTGVGYYDVGTRKAYVGEAPNSRELHPVLTLKKKV